VSEPKAAGSAAPRKQQGAKPKDLTQESGDAKKTAEQVAQAEPEPGNDGQQQPQAGEEQSASPEQKSPT
jgi:hypothetical protein